MKQLKFRSQLCVACKCINACIKKVVVLILFAFLILVGTTKVNAAEIEALQNNTKNNVQNADTFDVFTQSQTKINLLENDNYTSSPQELIINGQKLTSNSSLLIINASIEVFSNLSELFITPKSGFIGKINFEYSINGETFAPVQINVLNNEPNIENDFFKMKSNSSLIIEPLLNDTDKENEVLKITKINDVSKNTLLNNTNNTKNTNIEIENGIVFFDSTNKLLVIPNYNYVGVLAFNYEVTDAFGSKSVGVVEVEVLNQAPTAVWDNFLFQGYGSVELISILSNDFDSDNNGLKLIAISEILIDYGQTNQIIPLSSSSFIEVKIKDNIVISIKLSSQNNEIFKQGFSYTIEDEFFEKSIGLVTFD